MNTRNPNPRRPTAEPELMEREVASAPEAGVLTAITRAEIDGQIATARAFPRSLAGFVREAKELVSLEADMAEACIYSLPRDGKIVSGPSARFAEIVAHSFGNNRTGGRVVAEEGGFIVAQGVFHDLEKNTMTTMEVRRRITNKSGKRFSDDMIVVTGNAAGSIAHRNAVLKGISKALWQPIYEAAKQVAVGDVTTLGETRARALAWFSKAGVTPATLFAKLEVEGEEDIGLQELEVLVGLKSRLKEGERPEVVFAPDAPESSAPAAVSASGMAEVANGLKAKQKPLQVDPDTGEVLPAELQ